jgi:hypothetical protein
MDTNSIVRSIGQFNYENYLKNLATKVTTYTVGGVPLMTYGSLGITAALIGTMIFYEGTTTTVVEETEPVAEPKEEVTSGGGSSSGGGNKKKRKTRRRKHKKKTKH